MGGFGETDRAVRFLRSGAGDVFIRLVVGGGGGGLGVINLWAGSIVFIFSMAMELIEALR